MAMAEGVELSTQELLEDQTHVWNHIFNYVNSMALKCAVELGIPDAIHEHGKPITLSQLSDALLINKEKSDGLYRLIRILTRSKIFDKVKILENEEEEEEAYCLTRTSRLLLRDGAVSMATFARAVLDPVFVDPWQHMSEWFRNEVSTPFETKHGRTVWEHIRVDQRFGQLFHEGLARDSRVVTSVLVKDCKKVFEGLGTMVDVGGGTGTTAKAIADGFPGLKCVVLDLANVVDGLEGSENLRFVSGDMFEFIPPADAVFLKWILHDWSDEDCVRILKKCKEAITKSGKVIIVDIVVDDMKDDVATETQLMWDLQMLVWVAGKERTHKEWANIFRKAAFTNYKITHILGLRSVIELFP